jgi:hypothetical protein
VRVVEARTIAAPANSTITRDILDFLIRGDPEAFTTTGTGENAAVFDDDDAIVVE